MTSRLLPPAEWPRLEGTLLSPAWEGLDMCRDRIAVVEDDDGRIIGCIALMQVWHLEGAWVAPAYRKRVSVARRLYRAWTALFRAFGVQDVFMMAPTPDAAALCQRVGEATPLRCDHFIVRVNGRPIVRGGA